MLHKYFEDFILLQTQVFKWHRAYHEGREVI